MKLKKLSIFFAAAALSLTACKDDSVIGGEEPNTGGGIHHSGKKVYITTGLALPTGNFGRSSTDWYEEDDDKYDKDNGNTGTNSDATPDSEVGKTYENEVNNVILIFTDKDYRFITHSVIPRVDQAPVEGQNFDFTIKAEVDYDDLETAYDKGYLGGSDKQIVHVFAFCNYTSRMFERFEALAKTQMDATERTNWVNWEGIVEETPSPAWETPTSINTIWSKNSFTMTNASIKDYTFPSDISYWDEYTDENNPYKVNTTGNQDDELTPITVERVSARIDFKDGSPEGTPANEYQIKVYTTLPTEEKPEGITVNYYNVKLTRMSLVNMNKNYYYIRRVSKTGTPTGAVIGGPETTANYVVDYNWEAKAAVQGIVPSTARTYFNFPLYVTDDDNPDYDRAMWYSDDIENILDVSKGHDMDSWGTQGKYNIWRYVTENTIPSVDQQKTIQSTGIIFKGSIVPGVNLEDTPNKSVQDAITKAKENNQGADKPTELVNLYDYQNVLYGSVAEIVRDGVDRGPNSPLYNKVYRILRHWKLEGKVFKYDEGTTDGVSVEVVDMILNPEHYQAIEDDLSESLKKSWEEVKANKYTIDFSTTVEGKEYSDDPDGQFMALCAQNDITVYIASNEHDTDGWGYYCYYFYWNRHNDNNRSGQMGQMEFATVRNNVYKLSVTNISKLGHPRSRDFDPDPVEPEDPDEDPVAYIQIKVDVLPWVVRENNIKF